MEKVLQRIADVLASHAHTKTDGSYHTVSYDGDKLILIYADDGSTVCLSAVDLTERPSVDVAPLYQTVFPDYDNGAAADQLIAAGWQDRSWINESCPSFEKGGWHFFLEYAAPEKREHAEVPLCGLYRLDAQGVFTGEDGHYFDTVEAALQFVEAQS